jgi:hypothetical protein
LSASELCNELLQAEHILNTNFSFELAEPNYRRCLKIIEDSPQEKIVYEQLLIDLFLTQKISSEPVAYLMHILRWQKVRDAIEADLR